MAKSKRPARSGKADRPAKPYPDFPLTPHASGKWQKKIRGRIFYFGRWANRVDGKMVRIPGGGWEEALKLYRAQAEDLHAGRKPRATSGEGLSVAALCNHFLTDKLRKQTAGELSPRTFREYREFADRIVAEFGKQRLVDDLTATDFAEFRANLAETWGPLRLGKAITCIKGVFKYAFDNGHIDRPVRYGSEFNKPSRAVLRKHKASSGENMFEANEIHRLLDAASVQLKAMILLGVNCGFGNADCGTLSLDAVDLESGWIDYPRPKTGIPRRCRLWPETAEALKAAIAERPTPKDTSDAGLVFVTKYGSPWTRQGDSGAVTLQMGKLLRKLKMNGRRGLGFYSLRHTFRTIADAARDPVAVDTIMGHAAHTMGGRYRERLDDERLVSVTEHVRAWLWPQLDEGEPNG